MQFTLNDFELNLTSGSITHQGRVTNIRAKTLLVLKYLITHQNRIVTKQELLSTIWHDVVVQEQVLVQSIKEIRDVLGSHVIKTYSRQGYQWTAELIEIDTVNKTFSKPVVVISFCAALLSAVILFWFLLPLQSNESSSKLNPPLSIAFLPVENNMPDDIHDWVPLEGMDYLNQKLNQQAHLHVLESNDLLHVIERIDQFSTLPIEEQVYQIKTRLDVSLVVQTRLMGYPQDFQLHYTIYSSHHIERGVELADTVPKAFDALVKKIALRYSEFTSQNSLPYSVPYKSDFSNEAFASGLEYYLNRDYKNAKPFFRSALSANPELLVARRYLAACFANTGAVNQGIELMLENIAAAKEESNVREEIRSYVMIGYLLINWPETTKNHHQALKSAQQYIEIGRQLAERHQDKLFIAYAHEELGKIKRLQKKFQQAEVLLKKALEYHKTFRGSYGQTNALIQLARIAADQNDFARAEQYFQQATVIANESDAPTNKIWILLAQADVMQQQGNDVLANNFAQQAMEIAKITKRAHLISRVDAWFNKNSIYELN
jgi:DNA-binding winged helix-turn-helix (wHTH) protein/tetratricopeptide (TPR) repeat protein